MIILKIVLMIIGLFIGFLFVSLTGIILLPFKNVKKIDIMSKETMNPEDDPKQKQKAFLDVEGDRIDIDLFLPEDRTGPVGCIIMSNGLAAPRGKYSINMPCDTWKPVMPRCFMTSDTLV